MDYYGTGTVTTDEHVVVDHGDGVIEVDGVTCAGYVLHAQVGSVGHMCKDGVRQPFGVVARIDA